MHSAIMHSAIMHPAIMHPAIMHPAGPSLRPSLTAAIGAAIDGPVLPTTLCVRRSRSVLLGHR